MKVSGFTFLKNAQKNGYPFVESITSVLPIVDEFVCAIGESEDDTRSMVEAIGSKKIRIIETIWNEKMVDRGFVYGQQKMIAQYNCGGDWAFYIEADEVIHEDDLAGIREAMEENHEDPDCEALYFDFLHFYGTPYQIGIAGYRKAPRIIRNSVRTIAPDGLFWVVLDKNKRGRYPKARYAGGQIYHYGHCRNIEKMRNKVAQVGKYWGKEHDQFFTYGDIDSAELVPFLGKHPIIMKDWLAHEAEQNFTQSPRYKLSLRDRRNRLRFSLERLFKLEISKKHYIPLD
jgi:glycosyltransferase involved in cell wall biosynthesis